MDDTTKATVAAKVFYEDYRDGHGEIHTQATMLSYNPKQYELGLELNPDRVTKRGHCGTFVWVDESVHKLVAFLGGRAESMYQMRLGRV